MYGVGFKLKGFLKLGVHFFGIPLNTDYDYSVRGSVLGSLILG